MTKHKVNYLNIGCGNKFHDLWTNVDLVSHHPAVDKHNILRGLPYPDNHFDVIYHSQVLEHIPKENASDFLKECFRVLKKGGTIRVVCPDLENIAQEYLTQLNNNIQNPTQKNLANYDWIMLEMYDQTVRNEPGGLMEKFLTCSNLPNKRYIVDRIGYVERFILDKKNPTEVTSKQSKYTNEYTRKITINRIIGHVSYRLKRLRLHLLQLSKSISISLFSTRASQIGKFRLGGEVHMWMYDRFSLSLLLKQVGFTSIEKLDASKSSIPNWATYELDIKDGVVFDPTSLFMEARKPND